jgi:hypothetical protein
MEPKEWSKILENIIASDNFKTQINNHGYYLNPEYADRTYLKKEWNLNSTINTANFLSKDFWHQQSRILTDHNYYLIRAGRGSFVILDEKQFPRPYLNLNVEEPEGFDNLKKAFSENYTHRKLKYGMSIMSQYIFGCSLLLFVSDRVGHILGFHLRLEALTRSVFDYILL